MNVRERSRNLDSTSLDNTDLLFWFLVLLFCFCFCPHRIILLNEFRSFFFTDLHNNQLVKADTILQNNNIVLRHTGSPLFVRVCGRLYFALSVTIEIL